MIISDSSQFDYTEMKRRAGCRIQQMVYFKSTALSKRNVLCQVFVVVFVVFFFPEWIYFMLLGLILPSSHPGKLLVETSEVVNTTYHTAS